uniref:Uncharacterized protein n=1 Tax=Anguilla anguilla TaxID=7936 RepID=A0A0E9P699_ANGAN
MCYSELFLYQRLIWTSSDSNGSSVTMETNPSGHVLIDNYICVNVFSCVCAPSSLYMCACVHRHVCGPLCVYV